MSTTTHQTDPAPIDEQTAGGVAADSYVYLYPLVLMDLTRRQMTNVEAGNILGRGPMNMFINARQFPAADFRAVVRPNFDTLYSSAWLDLTDGPVVVSAADTDGRYYMLPMLDMWTDVFATPGKRTSGTHAQDFLVAPLGWKGGVPDGAQRVEASTPYAWIIGRTQTNGVDDYEAVARVQDGYKITPLAQLGQRAQSAAVPVDASVDMETPPLDQINSMAAAEFFAYGAELMKLHPPHVTDWSFLARAARIGIMPGHSLDWDALDEIARAALTAAPAAGLAAMKAKMPTMARVENYWQMNTDTIGVYGNYYLKRAIVAMVGLGANEAVDAVYPLNIADAEGHPLDGDNDYTLRFTADELLPVDAFWSVTMYDAEGFQSANSINRFAIGDRDDLAFGEDGSLELYLQHDDPGAEKRSNWLPAPRGPLGVTMRLYAPAAPVVRGEWAPPAIRRSPRVAPADPPCEQPPWEPSLDPAATSNRENAGRVDLGRLRSTCR
jgi:hypothetical protein